MNRRWDSLLSEAFADRNLVQSFSGVRTRFGPGPDISPAHEALAAAYGFAYGRWLARGSGEMRLLIGRDPRPTGPVLALALARGFLAAGREAGRKVIISDLGILTTPLIEAGVRAIKADGGVMITASHSPLADNGWKLLTGAQTAQRPGAAPAGALLSAEDLAAVLAEVKRLSESGELGAAVSAIGEDEIVAALDPVQSQTARAEALSGYVHAIEEDWGMGAGWKPPGKLGPCLIDANGGAACQIAAQVLAHFGVSAVEEPSVFGWPQHPIDTDGVELATGEHVLQRVARNVKKREAHFGIAFDYDADRGNLVLPEGAMDPVVPPQVAAAINVAMTLARREAAKLSGKRVAVVASDTTSGLVDRVAQQFGATVERVETGEVNVVTRMRQLRDEGFDVPIGVEGANGGIIFGNSTCRDGVLTALSAALAEAQGEAICHWLKKQGKDSANKRWTLPEILACLPDYATLQVRLVGKPLPHARIKAAAEKLFEADFWPRLSARYDRFQFVNSEGTRVSPERTGDATGGWKIELTRGEGRAFIFLRGSRTEAGIWRLVADAPTPADAEELLAIGRELYTRAQE